MTDNILYVSKHFEWSIKNFFDEPDAVDYRLDSPCVSLSDEEWFLRIYTNGQTKHNTFGYISLYLLRKDPISEHDVICRIGIKKKDDTEFLAFKYKGTLPKVKESGLGYSGVLHRSHLLRFKEDVVPSGTLTVFCTFRIMERRLSPSSKARSDGTSTLIKDLKEIYFSSFQSDLTIAVKGKEFRAHRLILSSRSPVFKSMLSHDMMEKNSGRVDIPDGDPDTFKDFLLFLYAGQFDIVSSRNAVSLYNAADKYDVKDLKDECARCMADELSDDTFCDVLRLATMQNEKDLLKATKDYFINNSKTIVTTKKWHAFAVEHPLVVIELYKQRFNSVNNIKK